jgi:chromosome segregation ATPase
MQKDLKSLFGDVTGLDEKSVEFLSKALVKSNLPGFDYLEYKQSLSALATMEMDEQTAIKSAYTTASTVGLTKDKLLKSAEHYLTVLRHEKEQFDQALEKQMKTRVESKRNEVETMKQQIQEYRKKIAELEAQIEKKQSTIDHADENIQKAKDKIIQTKDNFEHTFQSIQNQIQKDIEDIQQYL